jgi:hypothetical protein
MRNQNLDLLRRVILWSGLRRESFCLVHFAKRLLEHLLEVLFMLFGNFASIDFKILKLHRDLGPFWTESILLSISPFI